MLDLFILYAHVWSTLLWSVVYAQRKEALKNQLKATVSWVTVTCGISWHVCNAHRSLWRRSRMQTLGYGRTSNFIIIIQNNVVNQKATHHWEIRGTHNSSHKKENNLLIYKRAMLIVLDSLLELKVERISILIFCELRKNVIHAYIT